MKKVIFTVLFLMGGALLTLSMGGERLYAKHTKDRIWYNKDSVSKDVLAPKKMKMSPAMKKVIVEDCGTVRYECDLERASFRKCQADGSWSAWTTLSNEEAEIARACDRQCVPGQIVCPYRDKQYRVCTANARWSEFLNIGDNPDETNRVNEYCNSDRVNSPCWPGQYRCFDDGQYGRCEESGHWVETVNATTEFGTYINMCVFTSRKR